MRSLSNALGLGLLALLLGVGATYLAMSRPTVSSAFATPSSERFTQLSPDPSLRGISVTGEGEARAEPDLALITVGATQIAPTAQDAMAEVSRRLGAAVGAAKARGVQDRDIQTTGLSLQPIQRPRPPSDQSPPEIDSYRASNNVVITVRDVSRASAILDSATASGANVVGGIRFGLSDPPTLRAQALANAVRNARRNAEEMTSAAEVHVGDVISMSDEGGPTLGPQPLGLARAAVSPDVAPPIQPGELVVHARVRVTYAINL